MKHINKRALLLFCVLISLLTAEAFGGTPYVRKNKMFDIAQTADPAWGNNWCAPTAVGNSLAWLAKEYNLDGLMKKNGTGAAMSAKDVIDDIGKNHMNTSPQKGTLLTQVEAGKNSYIKQQKLDKKISVESQVGIPTAAADGSFAGWNGAPVTKNWLQDQFDKGQDVEFDVGYYEKIGNKWYRKGGHTSIYTGDLPGADTGGHMLTLAGYLDASRSSSNSDFQITFTDPGRDDLAGDFGALAAEQYTLMDYLGNIYNNTASTYQVTFDANFFGAGSGALLLEGYQGAGDFSGAGTNRTLATVLEAGWAESVVPEPGSFILILIGSVGLILSRKKLVS